MASSPIQCPNCGHGLEITVEVKSQPVVGVTDARKYTPLWDEHGHINIYAKHSAAMLIEALVPGRYSFNGLLTSYRLLVDQGGAPDISPRDFARLLKTIGCEPYRAADHRGYEVPRISVSSVHAGGGELLRVDIDKVEDDVFRESVEAEDPPEMPDYMDEAGIAEETGEFVVPDLSSYMEAIGQDIATLARMTGMDPQKLRDITATADRMAGESGKVPGQPEEAQA